jgi:hypothetical protein
MEGRMKMMKRSVPFLAALLALGAQASPTLQWGSDTAFGSGIGVVYTNGVLVPVGTHWLVELINTADDSVLYSTTDGFAANGLFFKTPDAAAWNGMLVKTVIYDAATRELATLQAQFSGGSLLLSWNTLPSPPSIFTYNAGYVTSAKGFAPGQWHAIPEPAVASLIGIFGGGMLMSRRIFRER